jgi:hypothetical protein
VAIERGVLESAPPALEVPETSFSQEEHDQITATFAMIEERYADAYDAWAGKPARMHEAVTKAAEAAKRAEVAEARAQAAELKAQELEMLAIEKRALLDQADVALTEKLAAVAAIDTEASK